MPSVRWLSLTVGLALAGPGSALAQQDLGHKIPGTAGLDAGTQAEPGLYAATRFIHYDAIQIRDRNGDVIPLDGFDIDALSASVGVGLTGKLPFGLYLGGALGFPFVRLTLKVEEDVSTIDRFGLGDVFVEPIQLGWRWPQADLVSSYSFFVPTNQLGGKGLAASQWSHQLSTGGTLFFDAKKRGRVSALFSYETYQQKPDIDVTRGDSVQVQGGVGGSPLELLEIGLVGYALWQIRDDEGADLPDVLRGRRDRTFGLGPELNLLVPELQAKLGFRYTHDIGAQSRPEGQLFVLELSGRVAPIQKQTVQK
jgi:hypothetical protein